MRIIGVTGGIGSGKSTVARIIASHGARVIDADEIARSIVKKGSKVLEEIADFFGTGILTADGELDRKKLAAIVFNERSLLEKLNEITHKHVIDLMEKKLEEYRENGEKTVVLDVPIPVERGFLDLVDEVWVVTADRDTRISRIMQRSGLSREAAEARINAQMSDDEYLELADRVIFNNGSVEELEKIVAEQLSLLKE